MKKMYSLVLIVLMFTGMNEVFSQNYRLFPRVTPAGKNFIDTRVDNMSYWKHMAALGYVETNPYAIVPAPVQTGSWIRIPGFDPQNSPDVPVTDDPNTTQSENSVFVDPSNEEIVINSNNSTDWSGASVSQLYGSDALISMDAASTWGGSVFGVATSNSGDPTTAIDLNGRWFIGKISNAWGQEIAFSDDQGATWTDATVAPGPGGNNILDKNHLWVDNSPTSSFSGNLYAAWTSFISGVPEDGQIQINRSADHGLTWSTPMVISTGVSAGVFNHGVNIKTGPDGECYVVWTIYDSWPSDEKALGFAKSIDGGLVFAPATRIIDNLKGIRNTMTNKNMRVNSFPVMAVDNSNGANRGNIYVVFSNIGTPGVNNGSDIDIYLLRSTDGGTTWSAPIRVNQDPAGLGKEHYFPWITCDPETGNLCVIYYDDREVSGQQLETWVSWSYDGGDSWTDMKVSDVAFTPVPIPGLASSYFGDYLGITSRNMMVYPVWTDNRNGNAMTFTSPFSLGPPPNQPFVTYYSNDLSSIPGKNKQNMNFGDSLYLDLGLKNIGDQPALNLTVTVSTTSSFITFTDSTESYGDMAAGEIKVVSQGYSFKVSDSITDGLKVKFDVRISDADTTWISHFTIEAHAPALKITNYTVDDVAGGNGNGRLDPGETVNFIFTNANTGDFPCLLTTANLSSTSDAITLNSTFNDLGTINPGETKDAVFSATVADEVSNGTGIDLAYHVNSQFHFAVGNYQETIGMIVEDWESYSFNKFPWEFGGNLQWFLTDVDPYEGIYSAYSGPITDDQTSTILVSYNSAVDDSISFHYKVSSESGWDYLHFYIDDVEMNQWSGEVPWSRAAYAVPAGMHTFRWTYRKDIYLAAGQDKAWIDFIDFPPPILPSINAGTDDTICAGQVYQLAAEASLYDSLLWKTNGDGIFDTDTIVSPVYTPGVNDIMNGVVKLTMTAYSTYGSSMNSMNLAIGGIPVAAVSADPNDTVCTWQSITLSADSVNGNTYLWSPGGLQTASITLDTTIAGGAGTKMYTMTVTNPFGCAATDTAYVTFKDCLAIEEVQKQFSVSVQPNPGKGIFVLNIYAPQPEKVKITLVAQDQSQVFTEDQIPVYGNWQKTYNFDRLASGVYLLIIDKASGRVTEKVVISK